MNKFITTLKNIWSIEDLRGRILFTLGLLLVYRFGSFVALPGILPKVLKESTPDASGGIMDLINVFTGGAFNQASVFALGIMPYITASIIVQLLGFAVPYFQRLQQREGESGRNKLNQITRWGTVLITLVQAGGYLTYISQSFPNAISAEIPQPVFWLSNVIILTAGTIFSMWLGEKITDKGIGNGVSLLIMVGIIATLPVALWNELNTSITTGAIPKFVIEIAALIAIVMVTVLLVQGVRKIPIRFAKRMVGRATSNVPTSGKRDYIPIKVNAAGVMPIIFAQAIMFVPPVIAPLFSGSATPTPDSFLGMLSDFTSTPYNIIYFFLVVVFTYVYTALLVNPKQHAEYLKRQNAFIPGIKPGKSTEDFIDTVVTRITLPGSIFLGLISILPAFAAAFGVNIAFAMFFGGTSLLIMVGVVLDTLQQVESHLVRRRYDGLVRSGRLKEKGGINSIGAGV